MHIQPSSLRTLTGLSFTLLFIGSMIPAPMARLVAMVLAALLSLLPLAMGTLRLRIVAAFLLAGALALTFDTYPDAITEYTRYGQQVRK
jgi:hypothetical protein